MTGMTRVLPGPSIDEVDRITSAWHRERPDLDVSPLEVLSRVTRLARHLDLARRQAFAAHSLETWEFDVLAALRRAGVPYALSPGQLGSETHVTSGTMTNRIDRLEGRALVRREPDPSDRRGVRVVLTDVGRAHVDDALRDLVAREHDVLDTLPVESQAELARLLRLLVREFGD
jgi:DNA-binding MarR family transcriptional regulator